jgi:hypothetical protein
MVGRAKHTKQLLQCVWYLDHGVMNGGYAKVSWGTVSCLTRRIRCSSSVAATSSATIRVTTSWCKSPSGEFSQGGGVVHTPFAGSRCETRGMARPAIQVEAVRFSPDDPAPIVEWMARLAAAGDGWVNIVPNTKENGDRPTSLQFFTLFGGSGFGLTMGTWIPATQGRRGGRQPSLGITHVTPGRAVARLQSLGLGVPEHWTVKQDHPRRGLVLGVGLDAPHDEVLAWAVRAITALTSGPIDGWRADVHLSER